MSTGSLRAYSRYRGVTLRAAQKAIEDGRIGPDAYTKKQVGKKLVYVIDFGKADEHWRDRTNADMRKRPTVGEMEGKPAPRQPTWKNQDPDLEIKDLNGNSVQPSDTIKLATANAKKAEIAAKMAELDYKERTGELIPLEKVGMIWKEAGAQIVTNMLSIPDRLSAIIAAEKDEKVVYDLLKKEIELVLRCLADNKLSGKVEVEPLV